MKISFCGDVCSECPRYVATLSDDINALRKFAKLWYNLGFRPEIIDPEEMKCHGCNKNMPCSHGINNCEQLEGISNCGECNHFPCSKISAVFEKTETTAKICKQKCSESEYNILCNAFLKKREILESIHAKRV